VRGNVSSNAHRATSCDNYLQGAIKPHNLRRATRVPGRLYSVDAKAKSESRKRAGLRAAIICATSRDKRLASFNGIGPLGPGRGNALEWATSPE
jgi:hypothetical protein